MAVCVVEVLELIEVDAYDMGYARSAILLDIRVECVTVEYLRGRVKAEMLYVKVHIVERDIERACALVGSGDVGHVRCCKRG